MALHALLDRWPAARRWTGLRDRLVADIGAGTAFVIDCQEQKPQRLAAILTWLGGSALPAPPWLQVLSHVAFAAPTNPALTADVADRALAEHSGVALLALHIAGRRGEWEVVHERLWAQLVRLAAAPPEELGRRVLVHDLTALPPIDANPSARAALDVVFVTCEQPARNVPVRPDDVARYVDAAALVATWLPEDRQVGVRNTVLHDGCTLLIDDSDRLGWEPAAMLLLHGADRLLVPPSAGPDVIAELLERPGNAGLLHALAEHGGDRWTQMVQGSGRLRNIVPWRIFREAVAADAAPARLALAWAPLVAREERDARTTARGLAALVDWPSLTCADALDALIRHTAAHLLDHGPPEVARRWCQRTYVTVACDRALGVPAALALGAALRRRAAEQAAARDAELAQIKEAERKASEEIGRWDQEVRRLRARRRALSRDARQWVALLQTLPRTDGSADGVGRRGLWRRK